MSTPATDAWLAQRRGRMAAILRAIGPLGIASAVVIVVAIIAAVAGGWLVPDNPDLPNLSLSFVGPTAGHLLGYDFEGRDVLSRLLAGARTAMLGPIAVVCMSMTGGTLLALLAAWRRGVTDAVISSGLD